MKKLILAFVILGTSFGVANAHQAKRHLSSDAWHATVAQQTPSQFYSAASYQRAAANAVYAPVGADFSQFNDH